MNAESFLREKFRGYYKRNIVSGPQAIEQREFGVGEFGKKISSRHLSFSNKGALNKFLREKAPLFISSSSAYYKFPSARPMNAKKMQKSDLIYEFDADDIRTDCKQEHDSWKCSCGAGGSGAVGFCSKCGLGVKVDEWVCPLCLKSVKTQVKRLIDFLEADFGVFKGLFFNYSGSKGFHIHLRNEAFFHLSNNAKVELVDYLTAHEIDLERLGFLFSPKKFVSPKIFKASGWSKKILEKLAQLFKEGSEVKIASFGNVTVRTANMLLKQKKAVLEGFERGTLFSLPGTKTRDFWRSAIEFVVEQEKIKLDRQTSVDASKIIRVPNTLHGSTGLLAKNFLLDELKEFDGLSDSIVFGGKPIKLKSVSAPRFYLGKQWWGPFKGETVELPEFVSVFLVAKGHALPA